MQPSDRLTSKEIQVAVLVWEGHTNREIASVIGTTEQVIKNYLRNTFDKLGVWSRLELALYVAAHGGAAWRKPAQSSQVCIPPSEEFDASSQRTGMPAAGQRDKEASRSPRKFRTNASPPVISA